MRTWVQSLALLSGLRIQHCCELRCRLVATAPIQPLALDPPHAAGMALKRLKKKKRLSTHLTLCHHLHGPQDREIQESGISVIASKLLPSPSPGFRAPFTGCLEAEAQAAQQRNFNPLAGPQNLQRALYVQPPPQIPRTTRKESLPGARRDTNLHLLCRDPQGRQACVHNHFHRLPRLGNSSKMFRMFWVASHKSVVCNWLEQ